MRVRFLQLSLISVLVLPVTAQPNVLTYHSDTQRTGQNLSETVLTPGNVNATAFGKLFQTALDGSVDAQPLYVGGVSILGQGTHNLLIVATENDSLYALDADSGTQIWHASLLAGGETPSDDRNCNQVSPQIGITATPVIQLISGSSSNSIFAVTMSKDSSSHYHQRLNKVNLTTGMVIATAEITAKYPGTGADSS